MSDDHHHRASAGQAILEAAGRLTPGQARRLAIRHSDAFSTERHAARVRCRATARQLGLLGDLDALIRAAARIADLPAVPERSQDSVRQVVTDAAVVALLGDDLDVDAALLLDGPWAKATRRRRSQPAAGTTAPEAATASEGAIATDDASTRGPVADVPAVAAVPGPGGATAADPLADGTLGLV